MSFLRVYAIFLRQFYLIRDNPTRAFMIFSWVTLDIVMWGFISKYLGGMVGAGMSAVSLFLGAVVLWDVLGRAQQGVMVPFLEDVWSRNFLNLFASPLTVSEYVLGLVVTSVVTSVIGILFMLALAGILFGLSLLSLGVLLVPFVLILFLSGVALGIFASAVVLRFGPSAEWLVWPIAGLLNPFVGVFYPVATLPQWMQVISKILPPTYVFEGMRMALATHTFSWPLLLLGVVLALGYTGLAFWFFLRVYRMAVRTGLIARYSVENAG